MFIRDGHEVKQYAQYNNSLKFFFLFFFCCFFFLFLMRRVQSLEFNNNSSSSISHQMKKVSLPPLNETESVTRPSSGWIRRSAANINARSTVVPMTINQDEIPNHFNSTMQSMCLAFFTLGYTEVLQIE